MDLLDRLGWVSDSRSLLPCRSAGAVREPLAAEIGLVEAERLDLRAHGAVEHEDAPLRGLAERLGGAVAALGARVEDG